MKKEIQNLIEANEEANRAVKSLEKSRENRERIFKESSNKINKAVKILKEKGIL